MITSTAEKSKIARLQTIPSFSCFQIIFIFVAVHRAKAQAKKRTYYDFCSTEKIF